MIVPDEDSGVTSAVVAGIAVGVGLIVVFSIILTNHQSGTSSSSLSHGLSSSHQSLSNASEIFPGQVGFTCPFIVVHSSVSIENTTGFMQYNVSGYTDYVIPHGQTGTITYTIHRESPPPIIVANSSKSYYYYDLVLRVQKTENYTNGVSFIHYENVTEPQTVTSLSGNNRVLPNGTILHYYQACRNVPNDATNSSSSECFSGPMKEAPPTTVTISVMRFIHPGINLSFSPKTENLGFNSSSTVTATFSVDANAPKGTYWMEFMEPGVCNGSPLMLFTVGDKPFDAHGHMFNALTYPPPSKL